MRLLYTDLIASPPYSLHQFPWTSMGTTSAAVAPGQPLGPPEFEEDLNLFPSQLRHEAVLVVPTHSSMSEETGRQGEGSCVSCNTASLDTFPSLGPSEALQRVRTY